MATLFNPISISEGAISLKDSLSNIQLTEPQTEEITPSLDIQLLEKQAFTAGFKLGFSEGEQQAIQQSLELSQQLKQLLHTLPKALG